MTFALRAHRLLCRLGLHLMGTWRARPKKFGVYSRCYSCGRDKWQPAPENGRRKGFPAGATSFDAVNALQDETEQPKSYPVDALNFPPINRQPRDGVTHEG